MLPPPPHLEIQPLLLCQRSVGPAVRSQQSQCPWNPRMSPRQPEARHPHLLWEHHPPRSSPHPGLQHLPMMRVMKAFRNLLMGSQPLRIALPTQFIPMPTEGPRHLRIVLKRPRKYLSCMYMIPCVCECVCVRVCVRVYIYIYIHMQIYLPKAHVKNTIMQLFATRFTPLLPMIQPRQESWQRPSSAATTWCRPV